MHSPDWYGAGLSPLAGGYSGETFVADLGGDRVVVRVYGRDPGRAAVDASLLRLVAGLVPVPRVLELRHPTPTEPAVLVTEYVAGRRLDEALAAGSVDLPAVAASLAGILNALAGIPFLRFGMFADADLTISTAGIPGDLPEWAEQLRPTGRLETWADADWKALCELLRAAQDLLDEEAAE